MIYVTGDMHGAENRLYDKEWRKLKAGDILLVCGDFGYIWDGGKFEKEAVEYLGTRKFTVAFIDGTHEMPVVKPIGRAERCTEYMEICFTLCADRFSILMAIKFLLLAVENLPIKIFVLSKGFIGRKNCLPQRRWQWERQILMRLAAILTIL